MSAIRREPPRPGGRGRRPAGGERGTSSDEKPAGGPRALSDLLSQLNVLRGHGRSHGARQLTELWQRIAGLEIGERTRVIGLRNGTLVVGVSNTALLGELTSFHKSRLLAGLRGDPDGRGIKGLKFQLRGK